MSSEDGLASNLRRQLTTLLDGGQAHATLEDALADFPEKLRGKVPQGLAHSAWQVLEHIRIAQRDILDFSRNSDGSYRHKAWPAEYWPQSAEPPDVLAWDASLKEIAADRAAFDALLATATDAQLAEPFAWGKGQNLIREALLIADHNAYHTGEIIVLRRLLGAWNK